MSIRSTSLEPKSQLTINLALKRKQKKKEEKRRKFPIKNWKKAKRENSQSRKMGERKKERKFPIKDRKKTEEICKKGLWTKQYLNNTELSPSKQEKKGNHDLKWSSPLDYQPKSCASVTCSPHTKQKQKRKRPRTLKAKFPTKKNKPFPRKSPIDP